MKEYQAYLFDLYGTLVAIHTDEHSSSFWKKAVLLFEKEGAFYGGEELKEAYFTKVRDKEKEKARPGHHIEIDLKEVFSSLLEDKGIILSEEKITELMLSFRQASTSYIRLYAGASVLLKELKKRNRAVYLLSNAQEVFTLQEMKELGIDDLFTDIFLSSTVGCKKPDPFFFEAPLKKYRLDPAACLMIGNDIFGDIAGARQIGMDSYYIRSRLSPKEKADIVPTYFQDRMDLRKLKRKLLDNG